MRLGILLNELINIAKISKTDFALSINMTPSGLSKILTGKRLPSLKEKKTFIRETANYFAKVVYCHNCYLKFKNIFPVIYDFNSEYELEKFLTYAIEYSFDKDFAVKSEENFDYSYKGISFLGNKTILNMFCLIISDCITNENTVPLEFYCTLPLFSRLYSDIFRRIKISIAVKQKNISFNHFFDMASIETSYNKYNIDFISYIVKAQQYVDLNLWKNKKEIGYTFLLLKGQFLLLFSIQMDGTPIMTLINHKAYLTTFYNAFMKKGAKKISYNRSEATAFLESNPSFISELINRHIESVYNFISIGYLIEKKELEDVKSKEIVKNTILRLFNSILKDETIFFVTVDAMTNFYVTGNVIVPLIGTINFSSDKRIPYLKRFNSYINEKSTSKVRIVNSEELPKAAILCSQSLSLVYIIDNGYKSEKIHCFETDIINDILDNELAESTMKIQDFSADLWKTYIDELTNFAHGFDY